MALCHACLSELPVGSRYCPACGVSVSESGVHSTLLFQAGGATEAVLVKQENLASIASGPARESRFPSGTILLGRYRIVSAVGRGGMGEIYRADDLRLHQQVALKFLTRPLLGDPGQLERIHREVRIAREVSHPLVCRIHDIAEIEGETFVTMEFIDGEDLGVLLKRIGRLPEDKGIQIARQLCDGLTAVHAKEIVHRDLKPGNIMIDGRGQARLTDFGLAVSSDSIPESEFRSGTPAYMAPEQFTGKTPTVQSDLFSLGLVLYEVFTGRRAFPAKSRQELARLYQDHKPPSVCDLVPGLDPRIDKAIRQCLEIEPALRPKSAQAVAAVLPKCDPLTAALAEGRTPSPEIVANAGTEGRLSSRVATALLLTTVLGVFLVAVLAGRATIPGLVGMKRSPEALQARAQLILDSLECTDPSKDRRYGFVYDFDYLQYTVNSDDTAQRWSRLESGQIPGIIFWYRQSPQYLAAGGMGPRLYPGRVTPFDPSPLIPGSASIHLDSSGRLIEFVHVPARDVATTESAQEVDFQPLFKEAKLDWESAEATTPQWSPPFHVERQIAWNTPRSDAPDQPLRVEAAIHHGKVAYFKVYDGPWQQPDSFRSPLQVESRGFHYLYAVFSSLIVIGGGLLARRNLRLGLGDVTGASRLTMFMFGCHLVCMALVVDHVPSFHEEVVWLMKAVGFAAFWSCLCGLLYFDLEPYVRQHWPWRMISWNRLLSGRFRDPMVGRDLMIGVLLGIFLTLAHQLGVIVPPLLGYPSPTPLVTWPSAFTNVPFHLLMEAPVAVRDALQWYFLLFLLVLLVRRMWLAIALVFALALTYNLIQEPELHLFWVPLMAATIAVTLFVALHFGLLAVTIGMFFCYFLYQLPLTLDPSAWYWKQSLLYMAWPILFAGFGFLMARGARPTVHRMP